VQQFEFGESIGSLRSIPMGTINEVLIMLWAANLRRLSQKWGIRQVTRHAFSAKKDLTKHNSLLICKLRRVRPQPKIER
jgi:hypothetical protein